jgi:hypothetical protein
LERGGVSRYTATPLIVALSPGHSDITSFIHGQQLRQEIIWISPSLKKFQKLLSRLTGIIDVFHQRSDIVGAT